MARVYRQAGIGIVGASLLIALLFAFTPSAHAVDVTSRFTLLKVVINDDGGVAVDTDWTLSANGATPISGVEGDAAVTNDDIPKVCECCLEEKLSKPVLFFNGIIIDVRQSGCIFNTTSANASSANNNALGSFGGHGGGGGDVEVATKSSESSGENGGASA